MSEVERWLSPYHGSKQEKPDQDGRAGSDCNTRSGLYFLRAITPEIKAIGILPSCEIDHDLRQVFGREFSSLWQELCWRSVGPICHFCVKEWLPSSAVGPRGKQKATRSLTVAGWITSGVGRRQTSLQVVAGSPLWRGSFKTTPLMCERTAAMVSRCLRRREQSSHPPWS